MFGVSKSLSKVTGESSEPILKSDILNYLRPDLGALKDPKSVFIVSISDD